MFASVFISASCVLSTMAITICLSTFMILDGHKTDFVDVLYDAEIELIIQKARMASSQIEIFTNINKETTKKMADIVNEMISPKQLEPDYPLTFSDANPLTWQEIPDEEKIGDTSFSNMSYGYENNRKTARSWT